MRRPHLPLERFLVLVSVRGRVETRAIVRLEELAESKIPVALLGIQPATFRLPGRPSIM
jgi:hypothetical protein